MTTTSTRTGTHDLTRYRGIVPPIVTPLMPYGALDLDSLTRLTRWLIDEGVHGIWACGTNGEFPCFTAEEREHVVATCVRAAAGRVPVIANVADCSTSLAIEHGRRALQAGADAIAVTPPYYYANSQDELVQLFHEVRAALDAPLFVYNIPSTVKVRFEVPTIVKLAIDGTIAGIKDSQGDIDFIRALSLALRRAETELRILLGTRSLIDVGLLVGAHGAIPGISNVVPGSCVETYDAAMRGDWAAAARAQALVIQANNTVKAATGSPAAQGMGGIKAALKALGIIEHSTLKGPLHSPTTAEEEQVAAVARELGLLAVAPEPSVLSYG
jgi:4-hydroxy-tetrahydrodipicolinate synthase